MLGLRYLLILTDLLVEQLLIFSSFRRLLIELRYAYSIYDIAFIDIAATDTR